MSVKRAGRRGRRQWAATIAALTSLALLAPWSTGLAAASGSDQRARGSSSGGALATLDVEAAAVQVKPAGKSAFKPAKDGQALKAGDTIRTDPTGRAQISYSDGSLTRLDVATEYQLVKLSNKKGDRKTKGVQTAGQTWHRVESLTDNDSYKVEGANATAAVLGTAFMVSCVAPGQCTFTAVVDPIKMTEDGSTKTVTLTPGDQVTVTDDLGPVTTLTQEELLAIQWITQNLLADQQDGKSPGTSELANQPDPPPTRPPSSPLADPPPPPPPPPPADSGTTGTGSASGTDGSPANEGPSATDDAYSMPEDTLLAIAAPGVLGNDSDPEGSPLEAFLTSFPANGAVLFFGDGAFVYVPDANFHGTDSFTYVAGDGEFGSNVATVTVTVNPVNDPPVAHDDSYAGNEDTLLAIAAPGVLANDTDADGTTLTAEVVDPPQHGTLDLHADGSFSYTPDGGYAGADQFTYQASDGEASDIGSVSLAIAPAESPCESFGAPEVSSQHDPETPFQGESVDITLFVSDPCDLGVVITFAKTAGPSGTIEQIFPVDVTCESECSDAYYYRWVPASNGSATVVITFTVTNGFASTDEVVTIPYQTGSATAGIGTAGTNGVRSAPASTTVDPAPTTVTTTTSTTTTTTTAPPTTTTTTTTTAPPAATPPDEDAPTASA